MFIPLRRLRTIGALSPIYYWQPWRSAARASWHSPVGITCYFRREFENAPFFFSSFSIPRVFYRARHLLFTIKADQLFCVELNFSTSAPIHTHLERASVVIKKLQVPREALPPRHPQSVGEKKKLHVLFNSICARPSPSPPSGRSFGRSLYVCIATLVCGLNESREVRERERSVLEKHSGHKLRFNVAFPAFLRSLFSAPPARSFARDKLVVRCGYRERTLGKSRSIYPAT